MDRFRELTGPLIPEAMTADALLYLQFLSAHAGVRPGPMAVVGFCFAGQFAVRTTAARPDVVTAAASYHGSMLAMDVALAAWGGSYQSEIYDGAMHGWMIAGGRAYHAEHAERGFLKLMELLDGTLKVPAGA